MGFRSPQKPGVKGIMKAATSEFCNEKHNTC